MCWQCRERIYEETQHFFQIHHLNSYGYIWHIKIYDKSQEFYAKQFTLYAQNTQKIKILFRISRSSLGHTVVQAQKVETSIVHGLLDKLYVALCWYSRKITTYCYHLDKKSCNILGEIQNR